jgi:hypothetical protein
VLRKRGRRQAFDEDAGVAATAAVVRGSDFVES